MADIFDWSPTPGSNSTVDGINVATGMPVNNVDNAIRSLMATIRASFSSTLENFLAGISALPVASGGTGATTAADARTALGLGSVATESTLPLSKGGTGATTGSGALTNIGGIGASAASVASPGYITLVVPGIGNLHIQWGTVSVGANSSGAVTYPVAFSTVAIPVVSAMAVSGAGGDSENCGLVSGSRTNSGFTVYNANNDSFTVPWIAVGF